MKWLYIWVLVAIVNFLFAANNIRMENEWWLIALNLIVATTATVAAVIAKISNNYWSD